MFVLRLLAVLTLIAFAGGIVAWVLTRDRKYLGFSWRVFSLAIIVALAFFALLIAEQLFVVVL